MPVYYSTGKGYNTEKVGARVKGVYLRCGTVYARWHSPTTGKEMWVRSPDGTPKGAQNFLKQATEEAWKQRGAEFLAAVNSKLVAKKEDWTIGKCFEVYKEVAPGHFAALSTPGRKRGGGIVHVLWAARQVFKDSMDRRMGEAPRLIGAWVEARSAAEGMISPTTRAMAAQAKSVFSTWALDAYEDRGCKVPQMRWRSMATPEFQYELPPQELRDRTIAAGKEELAKGTPIGRAFLLQYCCAMSLADAVRARWDWLGAKDTVQYSRHKTGKSACPPLPHDIAERWRELEREHGGEYVLPGDTPTARMNVVIDGLSPWMRSLGWKTGKTGHELRKLMCSRWYTERDAKWTQLWSGDSLEVLQKHYARLLPEKAPPAPSI